MNYDQLHPLFTVNDAEQAADFMYRRTIAAQSNITFHTPDGEVINKDSIKHMMRYLYGMNLIDVANHYTVQDAFYEKYLPRFSNIMKYGNIEHDVIMFTPNKIIPFVMMDLAKKGISSPPLNPVKFWPKDCNSSNKMENIVNPYASLDTLTINIYFTKAFIDQHPSIIQYIDSTTSNFGEIKDSLLSLKDGEKFPLAYQMLPANDFSNIHLFMYMIEKFV